MDKQVHVSKMKPGITEAAIRMTKTEVLSSGWELTKEVYSLSGKYDVE